MDERTCSDRASTMKLAWNGASARHRRIMAAINPPTEIAPFITATAPNHKVATPDDTTMPWATAPNRPV